ncbi:CHAT domain-containing protein [Streptomyces sp. B-S-A8]|uniref:CHAT domain-containing protein n=1 Tax=Streptomyces solicavernae TaxID=3043614 RepID=A0ABT6RYW2_9ACTN|nr:CHAT domain-containing protein [Streptomyces sp. B-S-A8]MDI3389520.1 CHAT domain-containing protein [Streptomyces sp. B-S-A8]
MRHLLGLPAGVLLGFTGWAETFQGDVTGRVLFVVSAVMAGLWAPTFALGYAVVAVVRHSVPMGWEWWVYPAAGAFAAHLLGTSAPGLRVSRWFAYERRLKAALSGETGRPVEAWGRLVSAVSWLLVWTPLVTAVSVVVLDRPTPRISPAHALFVGVLATAVCWAGRAGTRRMSRYDRRRYLTTDIVIHVGILLVVVAGDRHALPDDWSEFSATLVAMVATQVMVTIVLGFPVRSAWPWAQIVGSFANGTVLAYGYLVQPSNTAWLVSIVTSVSALVELGRRIPADASPLWWTRVLSAQNFHRDNTSYDAHVAEAWLNDEVRGPTGLALPNTMAALAVVCLTGQYGKYRWPEYAQRRWPPADAAVAEGNAWLDAAEELVDAAEPYAAADVVARARANCSFSKGQVLEAEADWTGAEACYRTATAAFTDAGLPDFAALVRLYRARVLAERLDRIGEAAAERRALAGDTGLLTPTRRWAGATLCTADEQEYRRQERAADRPPIIDLHSAHPPWSPLVGGPPPSPEPAGDDAPGPSRMPGDGPARRLVERGMERWRRGRRSEAAQDLRAAAKLLEANSQQLMAMDILMELARVQTKDAPQAAFDTLGDALGLRERFRDEVVDEQLRLRINGWFEDLHTRQIALLATASGAGWPERPARAVFDLAERSRSRLLLEQLGDTTVLRADAVPAELVSRERDQLAQVRRRRAAMGTPGERIQALEAFRAARDRLARTWREMAATGAHGAEYAQLRRGDPLSFPEVEPLLGQALLAEYHVTEDAVVLLLARSGAVEPTLVRIPIGRPALARALGDRYDAAHTAGPYDGNPLSPLVEPLVRHSAPGQVIWIVPHDLLHGVPLHAVDAEGGPLVERNPVCYTSAATVMRYCQAKHRPTARTSVVLADSRAERPLAHSRAQSSLVCTLLDRPRRLVGPDATVAGMTAAARGGVSVLHIACHGEFDAEQPERSRVLLAQDGKDDGQLTAERVLGLALPADLVTLSACRSGLAHRRPGDELFGLTRALIYAGASAVLVSLWAVDEVATGLLMYSFYRARKAGMGKAAALRTAQLAVRDATLDDVVAYCTRVGGEHRVLARELADARFRARDFAAAADGYAELLDTSEGDPQDDRELQAAHARAALALRGHADGPDYTRRIYAHPRHWAGFVLIGDWN